MAQLPQCGVMGDGIKYKNASTMGNLHYRLNFNPGKINKILYYSSKKHLKISKIAKFGGEML